MSVYRCFVEKKKPFATEANGVKSDLKIALLNDDVKSVRVINRYDLENIDEEDFKMAERTILSEPQVDTLYEEAPVAEAAAEPEKAETKEDEIDDTDDDFLKLLNDITKNK